MDYKVSGTENRVRQVRTDISPCVAIESELLVSATRAPPCVEPSDALVLQLVVRRDRGLADLHVGVN